MPVNQLESLLKNAVAMAIEEGKEYLFFVDAKAFDVESVDGLPEKSTVILLTLANGQKSSDAVVAFEIKKKEASNAS